MNKSLVLDVIRLLQLAAVLFFILFQEWNRIDTVDGAEDGSENLDFVEGAATVR